MRFSLIVFPALLVLVAGCGSDSPSGANGPRFLPIEMQEVEVNETLVVPLSVDNPTGLALEFIWSGPSLSGLDRCVQVVSSPSGGEFRYSPLSSHVGEHEFIVQMNSSRGSQQQALRINVLPAAGSAPIFLRPGAGGAFDMTLNPLVSVDVEVRDDDSSEVTLQVVQGLPTGADWIVTGPKSAQLEWLPTAQQLDASDRWPLTLEASDGQHEPTTHAYLIILRRGTKEGCPGDPPVVAFLSPDKGEKVGNKTGYEVTFTATDDQGLRDAPVLYWTTEEQEDLDHPNLAEFQVVPATEQSGSFVARIPSLGLAQGEERIVYAVASATDNDDPAGTACDHRTDTAVLRFIALGGLASDKAGICSSCDYSSDCDSGLCASTQWGGICLGRCGTNDCSQALTCVAATSTDGAVQQTCGDIALVCPELGNTTTASCTADAYESNDNWQSASVVSAQAASGTICSADVDYYRIALQADMQLTLRLEPANEDTGDLDLRLLDAEGGIVAVSAHDGTLEEITVCAQQAVQVIAEVMGYNGATGAYLLSFDISNSTCCVDDGFEPDDDALHARVLGFPGDAEGSICPYNSDYFQFTVPSPQPVTLILAADADLDILVYGPAGTIVASGETPGDEEVTWNAVSGKHTLRVFGYMDDFGEYLLEIQGSGSTQCGDDLDCPIGTVCAGGVCSDGYCATVSECPSGYECPVPGPADGLSMCGAPCLYNADCRPEEGCKYFYEGRYCGLKGSGVNGAACQAFYECGGQRSCIPWPKGYCARDNCSSPSDCEAGTFCTPVDGVGACLVSCWSSESACRLADGYACEAMQDIDNDLQLVCIPGT